jgi:1,5-anhydro-D-fructose reductase (1,5-anhydro-D-mannitol-forming)
VSLRVAVIGLGLIGRQRAAALGRIEGATLAATVDPAAARGGGVSGAPHYASLAQLPRAAYDAAVVAVPHDRAVPIAADVLAARRPVLAEKPLGVRGDDARRLESAAADLPRASFVGYNYRYLPAIAELLRHARAGELGELRTIDMLVGHGGHPGSAVGWKLDPARAGGGVLLDPGVHLLDLLLALAPAAVCVGIEATRGFWPTGIEEDVVATFRAERLIATVRVSHVRWVNTFRVEAFGEDGYAIAEGRGGNYGPMTLRLGRRWAWVGAGAVSQRESEEVRDFGTCNDSLRDELADVVARWRGDATPVGGPQPASMSEARRVTELCEQLYPRIEPAGPPAASGSQPRPEFRSRARATVCRSGTHASEPRRVIVADPPAS